MKSSSTYKHWGVGELGREPVDPLKQCSVGSYNTSYDGAWGWAGEACTESRVFVCKVSSE